MKIPCLITVCVAISTVAICTAKTVQFHRRSSLKNHPMIPKARYANTKNEARTTTFHPEIAFSPRKIQTVNNDANKKSGKTYRNHSPSSYRHISTNSQHGRRRRQLKHFDVKLRRLGRSYDLTENQVETIQFPETFEKGTIHIEPLYRVIKNKSVLDNLIDLFQKTIEPKSHLGPLVGPLHLPGVGDKVYIRLLEPVKSDHLVIRLITQLPYSEIESSFNQNIYPTNSLTKQVEIPSIEHQSVLSTDTISSSSSSLNNAIPIPSSSAIATDISSDSSKETSRIFKPFNMKSKYTDHRRTPALKFGKSRKRYPENPDFYKTIRYYNTNRPSTNSLKNEETYVRSQFKESQVQDDPGSFKDSSFYPYYQNHYPATVTSLSNGSNVKGSTNNGDVHAEASLNPVYVSTADKSALRQVVRTGRVVPMTGFVPKQYPTVNEALKVVDAPILSSSRVQNYSISVGYPKPQMRYLNLDGSVVTSDVSVENKKRNDEESLKSTRSSFNEKETVNSNRHWASKKRNLNEEEKVKVSDDRDEFKTIERTIAKTDELGTFLEISSKPQNVTVVQNTTNLMAQNVSRNTTRNSEKMAECLKCKYSEKSSSSTVNDYEYIDDPVFDDYYEDEELTNSTKFKGPTTTQPTLRATTRVALITTLKSVLNSTSTNVSQSRNLRKRLVMIKKTPIES